MSDRDYYEILGLTPRADAALVDQAYWHLARKYQTLGATDAGAARLLDELNEAYGVLGTPRLREQYDAFRDDVLLRAGMLRPVRATPREPKGKKTKDGAERRWRMPAFRIEHGRTYAVACILAALAFAAAWQGVHPMFVLGALAGGLGLALIPTLRRQIPQVNITLPSLPAVSPSDLKAPHVPVPKMPDLSTTLREFGVGAGDDALDPDVLRDSTSAMIARWRSSVGLRTLEDQLPLPGRSLLLHGEDEPPSAAEAPHEEAPIIAALEALRRKPRLHAGD